MYVKNSFNIYFAFGYLLFLASIGQIAADIYVPSLNTITYDLNSNINHIQLSVAYYVYGYGFMQIIYGPLSDVWGRRYPLIIGLAIALVGSYMCLMATTAKMLLLGRALQGIGTASTNVIYKAMIRDIFPGKKLAKISSYFAIITTLAIAMAPLLGSIIHTNFGWRVNFGFTAFLVLMLIILIIVTPETNKYSNDKAFSFKDIYRNTKDIVTNKVFAFATLATLLSYGGLLCWLSVSSFLLTNIYDYRIIDCGTVNFLVAIAFACGGAVNSIVVTYKKSAKFINLGFIIMLFSGFYILVTSGLSTQGFNLVAGVIFFSFGSSFVAPNAMALCLQPFKRNAGLAGSVLGLVKNVGGAIICNVLAFAPDTSPVPLAIAYILIAATGIFLLYTMLPKELVPLDTKSNSR